METILSKANWTCKAESWNEAEVITDQAVLAEVQARLADGRLPIYHSNEMYPCSYFAGTDAKTRPQFFVARRADGRRFLVDTQGYDYARYIAALPEAL